MMLRPNVNYVHYLVRIWIMTELIADILLIPLPINILYMQFASKIYVIDMMTVCTFR